MPPITTYGTVEGLHSFGLNARALEGFTAPQKLGALEAASRTIDSFMTGFTLPFIAVGTDLIRAAYAIAAYDLLSSRGMNPEGNDENVRLRYLDTMKWLEMVSKGTVTPAVTDSGSETTGATMQRPRLTSSSSRGYSVRGTGYSRGPFQGD